MAIKNEQFLAYIRTQRCAFCGAPPPSQAHHVECRGFGGGSRLDHPLCVLPACFFCHGKYQADREAGFALLDRRNGLEPGQSQAACWKLLRSPKELRA